MKEGTNGGQSCFPKARISGATVYWGRECPSSLLRLFLRRLFVDYYIPNNCPTARKYIIYFVLLDILLKTIRLPLRCCFKIINSYITRNLQYQKITWLFVEKAAVCLEYKMKLNDSFILNEKSCKRYRRAYEQCRSLDYSRKLSIIYWLVTLFSYNKT